jgi:hypothetical protein
MDVADVEASGPKLFLIDHAEFAVISKVGTRPSMHDAAAKTFRIAGNALHQPRCYSKESDSYARGLKRGPVVMYETWRSPAVDNHSHPHSALTCADQVIGHAISDHSFFVNICFKLDNVICNINRAQEASEIFIAVRKKSFFVPSGRAFHDVNLI